MNRSLKGHLRVKPTTTKHPPNKMVEGQNVTHRKDKEIQSKLHLILLSSILKKFLKVDYKIKNGNGECAKATTTRP